MMRGSMPLILIVSSVLLTAPALAEEPPVIGLTALHAMERILQHEPPFGTPSAAIAAARNEVESFQVVVAAPEGAVRITSARLPELDGPGGAKIAGDRIRVYREEYVRVRMSTLRADLPPGLYPDALVPLIDPVTGKPIQPLNRRRERWDERTVTTGHDMYGVPFTVAKGQNQPLWIDVHVPGDAPAGIYRGTVQIAADGGKAELPVTLTVWGFTLPDGPTHRNHFGHFRGVAGCFKVKADSDEFRAVEARYCQAKDVRWAVRDVPPYLPRTRVGFMRIQDISINNVLRMAGDNYTYPLSR